MPDTNDYKLMYSKLFDILDDLGVPPWACYELLREVDRRVAIEQGCMADGALVKIDCECSRCHLARSIVRLEERMGQYGHTGKSFGDIFGIALNGRVELLRKARPLIGK